MKIAILLQDANQLYGEEQAMLDLVCRLHADSDCDVTAWLLHETRRGDNPGALETAFRSRAVPIRVFPVDRAFSPALIRELRGRLASDVIDLLHVSGYKAGIHGGKAARFGRTTPMVATVHGWLQRSEWKERFYEWLELRSLRRMQKVVVLSGYYERLLAEKGVSPKRLIRIPSGIDLDALGARPGEWPNGGFTFGTLGRLSEEKNQAMFIQAGAEALEDGELFFRIGGEGHLREDLMDQITATGRDRHFSLPGYVDRSDFFSGIHAFVLPSIIENLPYTILEAMAWGRPVIATSRGGIPDLVEDGVTGYLVELHDHRAMAERMKELAADPERARQMGRAGRDKLEAQFSLGHSVNRHLDTYREVAAL